MLKTIINRFDRFEKQPFLRPIAAFTIKIKSKIVIYRHKRLWFVCSSTHKHSFFLWSELWFFLREKSQRKVHSICLFKRKSLSHLSLVRYCSSFPPSICMTCVKVKQNGFKSRKKWIEFKWMLFFFKKREYYWTVSTKWFRFSAYCIVSQNNKENITVNFICYCTEHISYNVKQELKTTNRKNDSLF